MNFSDFDLSILGEIGNVSVGGAATSLSDFANKVVTISIPDTKIIPFKEIKTMFEPEVILAKIDYINALQGSNILILKKEEALELSKVIAKEKIGVDITEWDSFSENVIAEIFNIMAGNMSASISDILNKEVKILTPEIKNQVAEDMNYFEDDDMLVAVWFEVRVENIFKLKLVTLMTNQQGLDMINIIKGDNQL